MRLRGGDGSGLGEEYIVFFVRPRVPTGRIALLFSTATYLAYANERFATDGHIVQPMAGQPPTISEVDIKIYENPEFGAGCYDSHADGAGICYSSYHRPMVNMRPKYRISAFDLPWNFRTCFVYSGTTNQRNWRPQSDGRHGISLMENAVC